MKKNQKDKRRKKKRKEKKEKKKKKRKKNWYGQSSPPNTHLSKSHLTKTTLSGYI